MNENVKLSPWQIKRIEIAKLCGQGDHIKGASTGAFRDIWKAWASAELKQIGSGDQAIFGQVWKVQGELSDFGKVW